MCAESWQPTRRSADRPKSARASGRYAAEIGEPFADVSVAQYER